ncbi:MAG: hypothetical protein ACI8QD_000410 [Cyclobacteriaceae bacterium]|jgi:uncharacterized protein (DUF983 family)
MNEKSQFRAIVDGNCPRCRKGKLFTHGVYNIPKLNSTIDCCDHCGIQYEREPGFFYGAMYVSYAFSVAIMLSTFVTVYILLGNPSLSYYIGAVSLVAFLLYPINFRYSRIVFLYSFGGIDYDPEASK